jgi:hypothetical protein
MPALTKKLILNQETLWRLTARVQRINNLWTSEDEPCGPEPVTNSFGCTDVEMSDCPACSGGCPPDAI